MQDRKVGNEKTQNDFGDRVIGDRCYAGSGAEQRTNAPGQVQVKAGDKQPIYKITTNVVDRTTKDKNHQHRNGATKIDLRGTPLMPAAHGEAKAESKQGYIESEVEFRNNESLHLQSRIRHGRQIS